MVENSHACSCKIIATMHSLLLWVLFNLHPGDAVVIKFRQPTALSKYDYGHYTYTHVDTVFVEGDTTVFVPFIGRIDVSKFTARDLQDSIYNAYSNYFKRPVYNISVMYRIYVVGEVKRPGEYFLEPYDDIWNAIGKAGGLTENGDLKHVRVIRDGKRLKINVWGEMQKRSAVEDIGIRSGDVIEVPKNKLVLAKQVLDVLWKIAVIWSVIRR